MLLDYRDPKFWENFRVRHWQPRVPGVLRQPFKTFPFSEAVLLQSLQVFAEGLRGGDERVRCLVSIGDFEKPPRRPLRQLFRTPSESLEALERNCERLFPEQRFGLMVAQLQAADPGVWRALTTFMQDARSVVDFPVPRAFVDLFYGNYSSTFTGLHKDTQEILAFVIRGKKRMLAWPFEYFLKRVKGLGPGDKFFNRRLEIDYRKYRKDALVVDANPGDIIYWPSDYWHIADSEPGQFTAMLSLGLVRTDAGAQTRSPFTKKLLSAPEGSALQSQDMTYAVTRPHAATQLRWATGFGFELGGPVADVAPKTSEAVTKHRSSVILWDTALPHRRLVVSANGQSIELPRSARVMKLLEQIARGEPVRRTAESKKARARFRETNWSKHYELKTRTRTSERDPATWLLDWLLRVHAIG